MKWFNFSKKDTKITKQEDGSYFYPVGAGASFMAGQIDDAERLRLFCIVPELNTILNLRARAMGNMKVVLADKKTGDEVDVVDPIADMLAEPNYFQSQQEFFQQTNLFHDIFGNEYIYGRAIPGAKLPYGFFTLPPYKVSIKAKGSEPLLPFYMYNKLPDQIVYTYEENHVKDELQKERLVHTNDNTVSIKVGTDFLKGASKIDPLHMPLENIVAAYEARNVLIVNRGAIGILSNATKDGIGGVGPLDMKEKEKVQREFSKYGLTKSQWQVIITNLSLNWQQMAIDVDKLKLFEETREDTLKICDEYGTPFELLSAYKNTTFDNKREAQRQWYRDTIIPESGTRLAAINRIWMKDKPYRLLPKFDHLPIFEEERKDKARGLLLTVNALTKALEDGAITIDDYKRELKNFGI